MIRTVADLRHARYSSALFAREWDSLVREGWTIISVDAQMCNDTYALYRAVGVMGAGWRYYYGGGYEIITDDPDFILDDLARNSPQFKVWVLPNDDEQLREDDQA